MDDNTEEIIEVAEKRVSAKRKIGIVMLVAILIILVLPYILIHIPAVQNKIKDIAIEQVVKKTKNKIEIGYIYLRPFNRLTIKNVYVEDLQKDTLLYVKKLEATISPWMLLGGNLLLNKIILKDFTANITGETSNSELNFMFIVNAFASKEEKKEEDKEPGKFSIYINNIELKNGKASYNILSEKKEPGFNASHINVTELNAELVFRMIAPDSMYAKVRNLSFKEGSGLIVKNLSAEAFKKADNIDFVNLKLQLPNSTLEVPKGNLVDYTNYDLSLKAKINLTDLSPFSSFLKDKTAPVTISGNVVGNTKMANLTNLKLQYGSSLSVAGNAKINDFTNWETSQFRLDLNKVSLNKKHKKELTIFGIEESMLDMIPDDINLKLVAEGTLPKFKTHLELKSPQDDISVDGTLGYNFGTKETLVDVFLNAKKINLSRWIEAGSLPSASSFSANIKGRIDKYGKPHLDTKVNFSNLFFNNYNYKNINISFSYDNNVLKSEITSKDALASIKLEASGTYIPNKKIEGTARIVIDSLYLSQLNYVDTALDARVRGIITADVQGETFERITLNSKIQDFMFETNKGIYKDSFDICYISRDEVKNATIYSNLVDFNMNGIFTYDTLMSNVKNTLAQYYPSFIKEKAKNYTTNQHLEAKINIKNTEGISKALSLPVLIEDTAKILLAYNNKERIKVQVGIGKIDANKNKLGNVKMQLTPTNDSVININLALDYFQGKDTLHADLKLDSKDKQLSLDLGLDNKDASNKVKGRLITEVELNEFSPLNLAINIKESPLEIFNVPFKMLPASILISEDEYIINNVGLVHSETEYLRLNGKLSASKKDSLNLSVGNMRLESILNIAKIDIPLTGLINGDIQASQIFTTPHIFTRKFAIDNIHLADSLIGDFKISSLWSTEHQAILLKSTLTKGKNESTIAGIVKPSKDSIRLKVSLNNFAISALSPLTTGLIYEQKGFLNTELSVTGRISDPSIVGKIRFKEIELGINKTLCKYRINDSVHLENNLLSLKKFKITDHENKDVIIDGSVKYTGIAKYEPKLKLSLDNFNVLNNSKHIDSLFFGKLRLTGSIDITGNEKDLLVNAKITNGNNSEIKINLPDNIGEAKDYESVIFINTDSTQIDSAEIISRGPFITGILPIKVKTNLLITEGLKLGVVINASTKDMASVTGKGELDFTYDMSDGKMSLLGKYTINEGSATISLKGLTKKKFTVEPGGTVSFKGDPLATSFNVTAIHTVRTYLSSLDPSFENDVNVSTNKVRVDCAIGVVGDINTMDISYNINLPNVNDDVKRKVDGLISTDEIKIKEVAYLLTLGSFYPPVSYEATSASTGNVWANLASSSLTNQLNNILSGVLKENWTIGTNFSADEDYTNLDMDVSVSTKLLNNRLTINTNLGMRSSANTKSTFVGDFDAQYKLTKSGTWSINAYNVTNDQYYKQAPTTQGVGVMYQKSGKTFKDLFKGIIQRLQRRERIEEEKEEVEKDAKED